MASIGNPRESNENHQNPMQIRRKSYGKSLENQNEINRHLQKSLEFHRTPSWRGAGREAGEGRAITSQGEGMGVGGGDDKHG